MHDPGLLCRWVMHVPQARKSLHAIGSFNTRRAHSHQSIINMPSACKSSQEQPAQSTLYIHLRTYPSCPVHTDWVVVSTLSCASNLISTTASDSKDACSSHHLYTRLPEPPRHAHHQHRMILIITTRSMSWPLPNR